MKRTMSKFLSFEEILRQLEHDTKPAHSEGLVTLPSLSEAFTTMTEDNADWFMKWLLKQHEWAEQDKEDDEEPFTMEDMEEQNEEKLGLLRSAIIDRNNRV